MDDAAIMVIEDDEAVRALLSRAFTRSGARVIEAEDGAAGMRAIYSDTPDAVLLDKRRPKVQAELTLAMRERGGPPGQP
jgi:DNA-binding response OmpR family regulator